MYEIKVIDEFCGAHNLRNYKGKCESLHGHNWTIETILYSKKLNDTGMIIDFKELKEKLKEVSSELDHAYLNDLPYFKKNNPTSENIAKFIHDKLSEKIKDKRIKVSIWETSNSCASFEN